MHPNGYKHPLVAQCCNRNVPISCTSCQDMRMQKGHGGCPSLESLHYLGAPFAPPLAFFAQGLCCSSSHNPLFAISEMLHIPQPSTMFMNTVYWAFRRTLHTLVPSFPRGKRVCINSQGDVFDTCQKKLLFFSSSPWL